MSGQVPANTSSLCYTGGMTKPFAVAIAGAVILLCGNAPCVAQTLSTSDKSASARSATTAAPAKKPAKPAAPMRRVSSPTYGGDASQLSDYWTIEKALPNRTTRSVPDPVRPQVGRVPLQNAPGTFGFESRDIRGTEFSDGRPVPGLTQNTVSNSSYAGVSLSVPSDHKNFPLFAPPAAPWSGGGNGW